MYSTCASIASVNYRRMNMKRERKTAQISIRIRPSLAKKLKRVSKRDDISQSCLIEEAIREMK
jgi:hypothetical protein